MRTIVYPRLTGPLGRLFIFLFYCAFFLSAAWRADAGVAFRARISGANYRPQITIQNETPTLITNIVVQIGDTAQHFESTTVTPADSTTVTDGIATVPGSDSIRVACTNLGFMQEVVLSTSLDSDTLQGMHCYVNWVWYFFHDGHFFVWVPEPGSVLDWRHVLQGGYIKVQAVGGQEEIVPIGNPSGVYLSATRPIVINLLSMSEVQAATNNDEEIVKQVTVKVNGFMMETKMGEGAFSVIDGCAVEILAPPIAYKDILGNDITDLATDPAGNANDVIRNYAEHRFTAIGLSVNDVPQTGDPTYYKFTYRSSAPVTDVIVKWRHEYALTIAQDFRFTACVLTNQDGNPWAGPLTSTAEGNPVPEAKKHWLGRGAQVVAEVDGAVVDLNHAGLDVRYVCRSYSSYGPPNNNSSPSLDAQAIIQNAGGSNVVAEKILTNSVRTFGSIGSRQQVKAFTMDRPGGIKYIWQIQYGVKVNVDDLSRADAPKVFTGSADSMPTVAGDGEGTFWFDPGTRVVVASLAIASNKALKSWINGDGFYFSSQGQIDDSHGGVLTQGGPAPAASAQWRTNITYGMSYRGLEIPQIQRPVRVMWMYGPPAMAVNVPIGEYVFQHDPTNGNVFTTKPDQINQLSVDGLNKMVGDGDMSVWDPIAARLYPLIPGRFKALWRPDPASSNVIEVYVSAFWPGKAHYSYIAGTPAVSVDPDPNDSFVFKEVKYTENSAVVDSSKRFSVAQLGKSVLLFGELQQAGRGILREYLRVRVVETKSYQDGLREGPAIIGQKITDPELDHANLGTGYVMPFTNGSPVRYNAFIYDSSKLEGIAAKDIYDMARLRSDKAEKVVINKQPLPGPIIPVNLHPGAQTAERINVVWYADPATHDGLLWPYAAKTYIPRWPTNTSEGLGRIVIASQYGSESVDSSGAEQVMMPETTNRITDASGHVIATNVIPAETTLNPSRFQQVAIYNQSDPAAAGYNPNEEHALLAPSLRYASVSPRPPAVYALRNNDLNVYFASSNGEVNQPPGYTSHPYVLVQFFDVLDQEFKMRVYSVVKEDQLLRGIPYRFADPSKLVGSTKPRTLLDEPHVTMKAGEPVIPFYPLGPVIGAVPPPETFGSNLMRQAVFWKDHKLSTWAVSGGSNAWFTLSFYYPLLPDFWWPTNLPAAIDAQTNAVLPRVGGSVSFLPTNVQSMANLAIGAPVNESKRESIKPTRILFKSDWPDNVPVLKAGETLTFQGGEHRTDYPTTQIIDTNGRQTTVETPGLPAVVAFATAEVVYDDRNALADDQLWTNKWTARIAQVLDARSVSLSTVDFPSELQPASKRTRVKEGKYVFSELPASLQKRVRYDPLNGRLEMSGLLNDKEIGDPTLTAAPAAVYILEPNIMTDEEKGDLLKLSTNAKWTEAVNALYQLTRNPSAVQGQGYLVGLEPKVKRDINGNALTQTNEAGEVSYQRDNAKPWPVRAFGPGLALLPNGGFLDPLGRLPAISYVTVAENNDPSMGGSPITLHIIQVKREERYRGAIQTVLSDNVFDENVVLRHTGDFGAHADELKFEWWYRPDDGRLDVLPPDMIPAGQENPWHVFPDPNGEGGKGMFQILLKGNPNAPELLLADSWWFVRYRHTNDVVKDIQWEGVTQPDGSDRVNFNWAGAGNNDPLGTYNGGVPNFKAQLAQGWIKRVLDAVNPYEARIRDFEGDNPSTISSMISQFGPRFEGAVALNPDKNVIENVGLIELYETILKRGSDLSINLSRPVSTPAIANALELASTRISDFYTILGNEAYADAMDPTIGFGSDSVEYGSLAPAVFSFQNQLSSLIEEELTLLRGVDDYFARPVYNRLFWNFTKGEGEAAYAMNYNISDINQDGFVDEDDAMILFPQGHGDAWGHYLTALRNQYDLLKNPNFNWVSRSEFYNLMDVVIKVDFLDERKFAQVAAAKAKAGAEIVNLTYRDKYVEDPTAQWQGYTDSQKDRAWGVQEWARRAGQGAFFDWITANALLPSEHPNKTLEGIQKVDRKENADIAVVSANLNAIQRTFDQANRGQNPLGVAANVVPFDINPILVEDLSIYGRTHFEQIYERALRALANAQAIWDNANEDRNRLRNIANSEIEFRNEVYQEDLSYRNQLISIFGKPYEGTIGPGKLYPAGYDGPDTLLYMYVDVRQMDNSTVPGPTAIFATFTTNGVLNGGDIYEAFVNGQGKGAAARGTLADIRHNFMPLYLGNDVLRLFSPTLAADTNNNTPILARDGWYAVNYTDLNNPKVPLENMELPVTAAGYTFQAPSSWGARQAAGELQQKINQMLQQEAQVASAIGAWDALQGGIVRALRLANAKLDMMANIRLKNELFSRLKLIVSDIVKGIEGVMSVLEEADKTVTKTTYGIVEAVPKNLPTGGVAVSPGDALAPVRGGVFVGSVGVTAGIGAGLATAKITELFIEMGLEITENELELFEKREENAMAAKEMFVEIENLLGDEPIKRIEIFKEIQALSEMSDEYRALLDQGARLIDERAAYNKRVAAQIQRNRYQDMTFRVSRNHALQTYRLAFDLAARYAYLAAKAYDYELNLDPADPGSPSAIFSDIVRARSVGMFESGDPGDARFGSGGLAEALAWLKANYEVQKNQLGFMNPQTELGKISLRTELFRVLPASADETSVIQPDDFPSPGQNADVAWRQTLQSAQVDDLWMLPEYRSFCRPFAAESDEAGVHVKEPALVLRFSTQIMAGKNFFGWPLSGGDQAYDPSLFVTKIRSAGIWFSDYLSEDVISDLTATPRVYLVPVGSDVLRIPSSDNPDSVRLWKVVDQRIPVPLPAQTAELDEANWIPLLDSLDGQMGDSRRFSSFRAYHDGSSIVDMDELVSDSRLIGRSVWNTDWLLIIPGRTLNADPAEGLRRFIEQVSDIKLVFQTYSYSGN